MIVMQKDQNLMNQSCFSNNSFDQEDYTKYTSSSQGGGGGQGGLPQLLNITRKSKRQTFVQASFCLVFTKKLSSKKMIK